MDDFLAGLGQLCPYLSTDPGVSANAWHRLKVTWDLDYTHYDLLDFTPELREHRFSVFPSGSWLEEPVVPTFPLPSSVGPTEK